MIEKICKKKENKYLLFLFVSLVLVCIQFFLFTGPTGCSVKETNLVKLPEYNGYINDYTGTLSADTLSKTEDLVQNLREETSCELAVAVIDDLDNLTIEEYAFMLFNTWSIGKKDKDNGVLLLISMKEKQLRIEVGYGLEAVITDLKAKDIIEDIIIPEFKNQDYDNGIYNGVVAIANIIYEDNDKAILAYAGSSTKASRSSAGSFSYIALIVILANILPWFSIGVVIGSFALRRYIRTHKCPKCKKIALVIKTKILSSPNYEHSGRAHVEKHCTKCDFHQVSTVTLPILIKSSLSGSQSSSSSFSSGSSSFSGSSHSSSFGGGSSGGGGASGSW